MPLEEVLLSIVPPNAARLSGNNRVIERQVDETFLSMLDPFFASRLRAQWTLDERNDDFTPQLERKESMSEHTPSGTLVLGDPVHTGYESAVFTVRNRTDLLVKYYVNCRAENGLIHPLLMEKWMTPLTGPRIFFVSPPALLPFDRPFKLNQLRLKNREWLECMSRNGVVRYTIMERVTGDMSAGPTWPSADGYLPTSEILSILSVLVDFLMRIPLQTIFTHIHTEQVVM